MKKTLLILSLSLAALSTFGKEYRYDTVPNDPLKARIYTLDNGLRVYLTAYAEEPRIQTYIAVCVGGKNDPPETTGLSHYLEHLLFKGTSSFGTSDYAKEKPLLDDIERRYEVYRTTTDDLQRKVIYHQIDIVSGLAAQYAIASEYDKLMSAIGASGTNAYTSDDATVYQENIPANQIENWAKIQAERFANPVIRLFHTELETVYEEKNMSLTRDVNKVYEAMLRAFPPPPLRHADHTRHAGAPQKPLYHQHQKAPQALLRAQQHGRLPVGRLQPRYGHRHRRPLLWRL